MYMLNNRGPQKLPVFIDLLRWLHEDWRSSLDRHEAVAAVAVDLIKTFDSVCHSLLLAKLTAYGFSGRALLLMAAYLRQREETAF